MPCVCFYNSWNRIRSFQTRKILISIYIINLGCIIIHRVFNLSFHFWSFDFTLIWIQFGNFTYIPKFGNFTYIPFLIWIAYFGHFFFYVCLAFLHWEGNRLWTKGNIKKKTRRWQSNLLFLYLHHTKWPKIRNISRGQARITR